MVVGTVPSFIGVGLIFRKQQAVHTMAYPGSFLSGAYTDKFYGSVNSNNMLDPGLWKPTRTCVLESTA